MKLSKQERIAAIAVIIAVIIVAGVFLFIKPNIETIKTTKATLENTKAEYEADVAKAGTKDDLKQQILTAYDTGKNLADMFFPELKAYEVDEQVRAFLEKCEAEIVVESLTVSNAGTAGLSASMFTPPQVEYALKTYVNQGNTNSVLNDPGLIRQALIMAALGDAQTIGASTAQFSVKAKTQEAMLAFADAVNNYQMEENGKMVRKAVEINSISFTDEATTRLYNERAEGNGNVTARTIPNATPRAAADPDTAAPADNNNSAPADNNNTTSTPTEGNGNANGNSNPNSTGTSTTTPTTETRPADEDQKFFQMECVMTFYSIERMSDPVETLTEQDKAAG